MQWPPRVVTRLTSYYSRDHKARLVASDATAGLIERCIREVLRVLGRDAGNAPAPSIGGHYNITFYTNNNFIASRGRLRQYSHDAYRTLATRIVTHGICVPPQSPTESAQDPAAVSACAQPGSRLPCDRVQETYRHGKATLGWGMELLQHVIFGNQPLQGAEPPRPPRVPVSADSCFPASRSQPPPEVEQTNLGQSFPPGFPVGLVPARSPNTNNYTLADFLRMSPPRRHDWLLPPSLAVADATAATSSTAEPRFSALAASDATSSADAADVPGFFSASGADITTDADADRASPRSNHSYCSLPPPAPPRALPSLGVLCIFKEEGQYMYEWLLHHTLEGVSQFVMLDQESSDNGSAIALRFAAARPEINLTLFNVPRHGLHNEQVDHYNRHFHRLCTDWAMIIDLDEFVYARLSYPTIPHFLAQLQTDVELIGLPWKIFGSSGHVRQPASAISSFLRRAHIHYRIEIKSLFRMSAMRRGPTHYRASQPLVDIEHQHRAKFRWKLYLPNGSPAGRLDQQRFVGPLGQAYLASFGLHFNHYQSGSCEYYAKAKMTRGAVISSQSDRMRTWSFFQSKDAVTNSLRDEELSLKRGADWVQQLPQSKPWPTVAHVSKLAGYVTGRTSFEADCLSSIWRDPARGNRTLVAAEPAHSSNSV